VVRLAALHRKLLRDVWRMRGQLAAVALVALCGTATLVTMTGAYEALVRARDDYYRDWRYADVFATARRAPQAIVPRIEDIPGVAVVEHRLVHQVTLEVAGFRDPASGLVMSVPDDARPRLNDLHLVAGRYVTAGAHDEVLLGQGFAEAHGLHPGDTLAAVVNGRWQRLAIVGIAGSPEFVYVLSGAAVFPDDQRYGVLWMSRRALEDRLDMQGAFNAVALRLAPGASERSVIDALDTLLRPWGGTGAQPRADEFSHQMLDGEIRQNRVTGTVVPAIFLAVTAFLIHNVLMRLIGLQRAQIGVLKSFGYGNAALAWHYLGLALAAIGTGTVAGMLVGVWLGNGLADLYQRFFHFPALTFRLTTMTVSITGTMLFATALLGALPAVRRVLALPPAEAMRPEPPPRFTRLLLERLGWVHLLSPGLRMTFRNMERRPLRAATGILAVAAAGALLVVGQFGLDAIDETVRVQFRAARHDDVRLSFARALPTAVRHDLAHLPGVLEAEAFRAVGARITAGHVTRKIGLYGLPPEARLQRVLDIDMREHPVPAHGLLLGASTARILGVQAGDEVGIEILEGAHPQRRVVVAATVDESIGMLGYMHIETLARLMGEGPTFTDAYLRVDPLQLDALYARLRTLPVVSGIALREATLASFLATIGENLATSMSILVGFAAAIAAGVVYNGARIALSEQAITLASLRILGFRQGEVTVMLLAEQALVTLLAIPLGWLAGYGICALVAWLLATELYRVPLVVSTRTYAGSAIVVMVAATCSSALVAWRVRHLDLVAVLKTRE